MRFRLLLFCFFLQITVGWSQAKYTISGVVKDASTGETCIGALVVAKEVQKGNSTNLYGFYSITLEEGEYTLEVAQLGYSSQTVVVKLHSDKRIDFELKPQSTQVAEVEVVADKRRNTESTDIGKIGLEMEQIKKLPVLLGEVDILKTLTLLPGVKSSGEGNAGFYVRGGGVDQNLILLDNATVYNASHLFGFFSVFNADAIKNLELTKGGMPANYGSRLASVLDISLKEGNAKEYHGQGGIGSISSRFTVEGPIKKDVSSFIISGRRTYIDALLRPFLKPESNFGGSGYFFYDLNLKVNYTLGEKDRLFASAYFGRDVFTFKSKQTNFGTRIPWGNATATLRWNRILTPKLFMNTIATFTDYKFSFEGDQEMFEFKLNSGIRDYGLKAQWNYYPNYTHTLKWGVDYTFHDFMPNSVYVRSGDTEFDTGKETQLLSHETSVYVLDEFDVTERLRFNIGLRYSTFAHVGPFDRFSTKEDRLNNPALPPVLASYDRGELVKFYHGLEPRGNVRWILDKYSSVKAGYMRNLQYVHLTSLSPTSLPTDVWLPSSDMLKPQLGEQISAGYFRNFMDDTFESSVEVYYKTMKNQSEFKEGAQPDQTVNDNIDNLLVFGKGNSYGVEFFVKKRLGDLSGWVGYTWSKTQRIFEAFNQGKAYPTRWDRRHDVNFVISYKFNARWEAGGVFVYSTGNAITLPTERYFYEGRVIDVYGDRNGYRMAPYHRADLSVTYYSKPNRKVVDAETGQTIERPKRFRSNWNFAVYNLYNRKNPYFIYFGNDGDLSSGKLQIKAYQVSLFPILPSITWNFEF